MSYATFVILTVIVVVVVLLIGAATSNRPASANVSCRHCGASQPAYARFCRKCGKAMDHWTQGQR